MIAYTPETFFYTLSSYNKFITKDNKDVDNGAELDFDLTKRVTDDEGNESINYSGLYDLEDISRKIDLVSFTNLQKQLADVNGDGRVSVLDVTCVQKYLAKYTTGCGKTGEAMS